MKQRKERYVSPQIEVIRMENEGVIAASGGTGSVTDMPNNQMRTTGRGYNSASTSDLEDLINDILTVEN